MEIFYPPLLPLAPWWSSTQASEWLGKVTLDVAWLLVPGVNLSIAETADSLRFSHATISRVVSSSLLNLNYCDVTHWFVDFFHKLWRVRDGFEYEIETLHAPSSQKEDRPLLALCQRPRLCLISPPEPLCFEFALSDSLIVLSSGLDVVIPSQTLILGDKWSKFLWPLVEGGHTCKLHVDKPPLDGGFEPRNILLWGKSANHHTTLKNIYY